MADESKREAVADALRRINQAWLGGRAEEMESVLHRDVVLAPPGFAGRERGRDGFIAGHRDFVASATIQSFSEDGHEIDVVGDTAVATYRYEMLYEHAGGRFRSTGRDLWIFQSQGGAWVAVWRTILDVEESAA